MGEMAFFSAEKENERSCSAEALIPSEVIEISFSALGKTIEGLNPWFRVVFNTMANRLRKTNARLTGLESNNVSRSAGSDHAKSYKFFITNDIIRSLSVLFLAMRSHGEQRSEGTTLNMKPLIFYAQDIFNIAEVKFLEICNILSEHNLCSFISEDNGISRKLIVKDSNILRDLMIFFNTQKVSAEDKQVKISYRCESFLDRIMEKIKEQNIQDNKIDFSINEVLEEFKNKRELINISDLEDAKHHGLVGEVSVIEKGNLSLPVNVGKIKKMFTAIKIMNAIERFNESKQKLERYGQ